MGELFHVVGRVLPALAGRTGRGGGRGRRRMAASNAARAGWVAAAMAAGSSRLMISGTR